jgi:trigger factor
VNAGTNRKTKIDAMQVTETTNQGLKREYRVVVTAADLEAKVDQYLDDLKGRVRLNGFRPGKVPVSHLKRLYGRAAMAEVIENTVRDANAKIVSDHNLKLAAQPKVNLPEEQNAIEGVIAGKADLDYTVAVEVVPAITLTDFKAISLERPVATVSPEEVEEALKRIADQNKPYAPKGEGAKAEEGDQVTINFTGTLDGKPFEGGTGEDIVVQIGAGGFIPGFEEQLVGIGVGESRKVTVTFPTNYLNAELAGREAVFDVTAKSIAAAGTVTLDDEFAKSLGLESLEKLKEAVTERLQRENAAVSRRKVKRALLDELDKRHKFEAPETLVSEEFEQVWQAITGDLKQQNRTFEDEGTTEEKAREEYRTIAERRVRLGLVLAEIGEKNNITVTDEEVSRAVVERARQLPGREQQVWDYYRKNPNALASLRAPIFEEKVVDFILELATVTEKPVSHEELNKDDEGETPPVI